jgi:putative membrane protein
MSIADLPALNATLNGTAAVLLSCGYVFIRRGRTAPHRACMLTAFVTSVAFLVSYLTYHAVAGARLFPGTGAPRAFYLTILATHTLLAALVPPLAIAALVFALRRRFDRHRRLARWTLPIWLYVSVTGVVIYVMLYRMTWSG